jgi:nicotinate-nucleotide adenylyltransferase
MRPCTAVYGGMFDPVHNGHIEAARFALRQLQLDRLKMVRCSKPNHREDATVKSAHRLRMLELATINDPDIEIDPIEINREGISYTSETLEAYKRLNPETDLVFVMGMDSLNSLPTWHDYGSILMNSNLFVLSRPGEEILEKVVEPLDLQHRKVENRQELLAKRAGGILLTDEFQFDISSSRVRDNLQNGVGVTDQLDQEVLSYIRNNNLYGWK